MPAPMSGGPIRHARDPNAPAADTGGQGEQPTVESGFLADAKERLYGLFHLITFRGLRRGEACGLRKTDRNRAQKTLTIATQLVLDGSMTRGSRGTSISRSRRRQPKRLPRRPPP